MPPRKLTREALYDAVWSGPLTRIAASFGISATGLAKVCDRHRIPRPPQGHWAKEAAGKSATRPSLPAPPEGTTNEIMLDQGMAIAASLPRARRVLEGAGLAAILDAKPVVPSKLANPHPVIRDWLGDLQAARGKPAVGLSSLDRRRYRVLDTIFKALDPSGVVPSNDPRRGMRLALGADDIEISLRERCQQVKRPLTEDEKRWEYVSGRTHFTELQGTGWLIFEIKSYFDEPTRRIWRESDAKHIEGRVPEICMYLLVGLELKKRRRLAREEEARRFNERQAERAAQQARAAEEQARWDKLVADAADWKGRQLVADYLAAMRASGSGREVMPDGMDPKAWEAWVARRLAGRS